MSRRPAVFPWLPANFLVGGDFAVRRVIDCGPADGALVYQLLDSQADGNFCVLIKTAECAPAVKEAMEAMNGVCFADVSWGKDNFSAAVFARDNKPFRLAEVFSRPALLQSAEAKELARGLAAVNNFSWLQSLYLPQPQVFLPFGKAESAEDRRLIAAKMLTGGSADAPMSPKQIHAVNKWLTPAEISGIFNVLKIPQSVGARRPQQTRDSSEFILPGQPELEAFFREHVVDYYRNYEKHMAMGNKPVGGVLLHGKPGSGKTYAVRQLADFLGWHMFEIGIGQVGSPLAHQTSMALRRQFDKAMKHTPSIVFMDEIDALGGERDFGAQSYKVEEISELLKAVEAAVKEGVFVIAATNRPDAIDPALKRTGRFDYHIEVRYPDAEAMHAILLHCLSQRPHKAGINLRRVADVLSGKPAAEAEFIINEAGRIAVSRDKAEIDDECLAHAIRQRGA